MSISVTQARAAAAAVRDPEIPALTVDDLGILRDVRVAEDGSVDVEITPTYTGCPAMDVIRDDIAAAVRARGAAEVKVHVVLAPTWSTDAMGPAACARLHADGIAPPPRPAATLRELPLAPACPRCGSPRTSLLSRFGATACQSLHRCLDCREAFTHFKPH